jgi:hypothetical protein
MTVDVLKKLISIHFVVFQAYPMAKRLEIDMLMIDDVAII